MNFFEQQDRARRATTVRVWLLTLVALSPPLLWLLMTAWIDEASWLGALILCVFMLPFIAVGYWYEIRKLKGGGDAIAEQLDGDLISFEPADEEERWLLDIVEEMAIASGSPVPLVYILDRAGINAFALGSTPANAVIGVTYDALVLLNREELQAVIAHLLSQLHTNDLRLDARMNAVGNGCGWIIALLALAGAHPLGATLLLVGCGWLYVYNLLVARTNRQRKFLADASAAQFTRNPQSVASALKKIISYEDESWLLDCNEKTPLAIYFAAPEENPKEGSRSPYPTLEERIWRIDPDWDGEYLDMPELESLIGDDKQSRENRRRWEVLGAVANIASNPGYSEDAPCAATLYQTRAALDKIPQSVRSTARQPSGAQALIYRLLLSPQAELRTRQLAQLQRFIDADVDRDLQKLEAPMTDLDLYLRLPLIDLCIPALRQLTPQQYTLFRTNLTLLIVADGRQDVLEWTLVHILELHLRGKPRVKRHYTLAQRAKDVALILALLAFTGQKRTAYAERAYYRASDVLPYDPVPLKAHKSTFGLEDFDKALNNLRQLKPHDKQILLEAMAVCIEDDAEITPQEIELLRATADILDCPMPEGLQTPLWQPFPEEATALV